MSSPCTGRPHRWGSWQNVKLRGDWGNHDTQRRYCERCGRRQMKHWWNR